MIGTRCTSPTAAFLGERGHNLALATFDTRQIAAAQAVGLPLLDVA
jgi:hypothetical protein